MSTFTHNFNFRAVPATNDKYAALLAGLQAAGLPYATVTEINGKKQDGIQRTAFTAELPVVSVADLAAASPEFVQRIVNGLVAETCRKLFVDQLKPIGEISLQDIIAANTPKEREQTLPKELLDAFIAYITDVMTQKGVKAGTVATIVELVKGRFTSAVLNKHQKEASKYPVILERLVGYLEFGEGAVELFTPVVTVLTDNYARWVELQASKDDELELDGL